MGILWVAKFDRKRRLVSKIQSQETPDVTTDSEGLGCTSLKVKKFHQATSDKELEQEITITDTVKNSASFQLYISLREGLIIHPGGSPKRSCLCTTLPFV